MSEENQNELTMLRDSARDFTRRWTDHKHLRALRGKLPGYDDGVLVQMRKLGWHGILFPEAYGGLGLGFAAMAVVIEELGRGLITDPLIPNVVLAGRALLHGDGEALKSRLLPQIASGALQAGLAWQETAGTLDPAAVQTLAKATGDGVRLSGSKRFVAGAAGADGFLVTAQRGANVVLYWVPRDARGLEVSFEWRADGTPSGLLTLDGVSVGAADVAASSAVAAVSRAVDEAAVMAGAEMLGVMRAALNMTVEYLRNRVQFDRPIGSFQALQHRAVDLYIQQELAAAVVAEAADLLDQSPAEIERIKMVSRTKNRCNEAGLRITRDAIQLHGGIGTTDECDIGLYFKRTLMLAAWLGSSPAQRRRYSAITLDALRKSSHAG